jgi:hypothetical protein
LNAQTDAPHVLREPLELDDDDQAFEEPFFSTYQIRPAYLGHLNAVQFGTHHSVSHSQFTFFLPSCIILISAPSQEMALPASTKDRKLSLCVHGRACPAFPLDNTRILTNGRSHNCDFTNHTDLYISSLIPLLLPFLTPMSHLALANRDVPGAFSFFDTSIMCAGNPAPVPADLRHFCAADDPPVADDAVALITAKAFSPGQNVAEDFTLDTVDIEIFPGNPHSTTYEDHVPSARPPNVFANGTVTDSMQACGDPIATFLITVSEFVRNSRKQSVVL